MAVTAGHGNPDWTKDETILALELYQSCGGKLPGGDDPRVIALSDLLRQLPLHPDVIKKPSFRNPDGVAFKLLNLNAVEKGKGLSTSYTDRATWGELGHLPEMVRSLSSLIRISAQAVAGDLQKFEDEDEDMQFSEGRVATALHLRRERSPALRKNLLKARSKKGPLSCDVCAVEPLLKDGNLQEAIFEAHHLTPLAIVGESNTKLSDVALLCASCHRLIHRVSAVKKQWFDVAALKALVSKTLPDDAAALSALNLASTKPDTPSSLK